MGNGDLLYLLFPFVLSIILVFAIIFCCLKCKLLVERPHGKVPNSMEELAYGNLINIQEYAENQFGTTIVYAESPTTSAPLPYVYYSDGRTATIVPIQPSPYDSMHRLCRHSCVVNNNSTPRNSSLGGTTTTTIATVSSIPHNEDSPPLGLKASSSSDEVLVTRQQSSQPSPEIVILDVPRDAEETTTASSTNVVTTIPTATTVSEPPPPTTRVTSSPEARTKNGPQKKPDPPPSYEDCIKNKAIISTSS